MVKAVVGANWGDEGKGKITDMLAQESDIIVRFQGEQLREIRTSYPSFRCVLRPYYQRDRKRCGVEYPGTV